MVMIFASKKARTFLLDQGRVYTFRKKRRGTGKDWINARYGGPKLADVHITEIGQFSPEELAAYVPESGFGSLEEWINEIRILGKGTLPESGWLYFVQLAKERKRLEEELQEVEKMEALAEELGIEPPRTIGELERAIEQVEVLRRVREVEAKEKAEKRRRQPQLNEYFKKKGNPMGTPIDLGPGLRDALEEWTFLILAPRSPPRERVWKEYQKGAAEIWREFKDEIEWDVVSRAEAVVRFENFLRRNYGLSPEEIRGDELRRWLQEKEKEWLKVARPPPPAREVPIEEEGKTWEEIEEAEGRTRMQRAKYKIRLLDGHRFGTNMLYYREGVAIFEPWVVYHKDTRQYLKPVNITETHIPVHRIAEVEDPIDIFRKDPPGEKSRWKEALAISSPFLVILTLLGLKGRGRKK